jgi:mannose-1-phosphate guanylyltransferase/phosphomannomutase
VRLVAGDAQSVVIRFFDREGLDIDESTQRKIERLFAREDYRRAFAADIGDIGFPPRILEFYTAALMATVDARGIRDTSFKLVLDYAYGSTSFVMPTVLSKLGADVLALNPYAATARAAAFDAAEHARHVADLVTAAGAHLGAVIHPDGEQITIIDDGGHVLSNDEALLALVALVGQAQEGARVAIPVSVGQAVEQLCRDAGAEIVWTKLSTPHIMEVAATQNIALAASQEGGYIFPSFMPAYDATATLINLLDLLATTGVRLSKVVSQLPRSNIARETVPTPWEQKGTVMRTLVEASGHKELVLVDGVKLIVDDGWVLVLPDPEQPLTHVWAEGATIADARSLAQQYARTIRQVLND